MTTRPLLVGINAVANGVLRLLRVEPKQELDAAYAPQELALLIDESVAQGLLHLTEQEQLTRALSLDARPVRDATIALADMVTIGRGSTGVELEQMVARTGYSRFPVQVSEQSGHPAPVAYVHAKDLLELTDDEYRRPIPARLIRPMVLVDADLPLIRAFTALQQAGHHMGRVFDNGTTLGVITLEDVLEELVGEIRDASHRPDGHQ